MLASSTDFLAYVVVMFLLWIYVPYILFRLYAERNVDLGRSRDETWFEEMIGAFLPSIVLNIQAGLLYWGCSYIWPNIFSIDLAVMASMFGQNRGAVSDYVYSGDYKYCAFYLGFLWLFAFVHGRWFGWAAAKICTVDAAWEGIEYITQPDVWKLEVKRKLPPNKRKWILIAWWIWFRFFRESIVPLYTWREQPERDPTDKGSPRLPGAFVRVETKGGAVYRGKLVGYEKTTGGEIDAIRLKGAKKFVEHVSIYGSPAIYLKWSEIVEMSIDYEETQRARKEPKEPTIPIQQSADDQPRVSA